MTLKDAIKGLVTQMRETAIQDLRDNVEVPLMIALVITANPRTGAPIEGEHGRGLMMLTPTHFDNEEDKDAIAHAAKMLAIAGRAVGAVTMMDAWLAEVGNDEAIDNRTASRHFNRVEALIFTTELADGQGWIERTIYRRDQGVLIFEPTDEKPIPLSDLHGRFEILPRTSVSEQLRDKASWFAKRKRIEWISMTGGAS